MKTKFLHAKIKEIILKILGTMALGSTDHCSSLVEKGGIEIFLKYLQEAEFNNQKQTLEIVTFTHYH